MAFAIVRQSILTLVTTLIVMATATTVFAQDAEPSFSSDEPSGPVIVPTAVTVLIDILPGASGTVTSAPSGLNCTGHDISCTAQFEANTAVALTATPVSGQTFLGWGGACTGTSTCIVTAADNLLVTAAFSAPASATITYYHTDVLGSVRAITDVAGMPLTRFDFLPFGESNAQLSGDPRKFLGLERDAETAFDYLGARYYRNLWGRFTSADDSVFMNVNDPRSSNRYAYALNNPLRWVDPNGHDPQDPRVPTVVEHVEVTAKAAADPAVMLAVGSIFGGDGLVTFIDTWWSVKTSEAQTLAAYRRDFFERMRAGDPTAQHCGPLEGCLIGIMPLLPAGPTTWISNATRMGSRFFNLGVQMTADEFSSNLLANGYKIVGQAVSRNGGVTVLSNGAKTYSIYTASSTGAVSADVFSDGVRLLKIRIGGW